MKFLLVMPFMKNALGGLSFFYPFPLGICYISAALKQAGDIKLLTLNLNQTRDDPLETLAATIRREEVDVLMTGGLCSLYGAVRDLLQAARSARPGLVTVVGGGLISGDPEAAMEALELADIGIIGEGEATVVELARTLQAGGELRSVPGLVLPGPKGWFLTPPRQEEKELDRLPWVDYEGFGFDEYLRQKVDISVDNHGKWLSVPALYMLTSRSCPHRCTFCFHPEGRSYRRRSLNDVFAELDRLRARYDFEVVYFVDELIGSSWLRLQEFCAGLKSRGQAWISSFRVSDFSPEKARLVKDSGCRGLFFGLESPSDHILKAMNKGITVRQIEATLMAAAEAQIPAQGGFLFGAPEQTHADCIAALEWFLEHPGFNIKLTPLYYYPGTDIYRRAVAVGAIPDRAAYLRHNQMAIYYGRMSREEYLDIIENQIPRYLRLRLGRLPQMADSQLTETKSSLTVTGRCAACGQSLTFSSLSPYAGREPFVCEYCAVLQSVPALVERDQRVRPNLERLLEQYGSLAFWGLGAIFKATMDPAALDLPGLRLIDRRHGGNFGPKIIESPDALAKSPVNLLIIPVWGNAANGSQTLAGEIRHLAESCYGIRHFVDYGDLWLTKF